MARGGIALSSVYLLGYFGQQIIFDNPGVRFILGFIDGGKRAQELVSQVDSSGALTAGATILASFGVLGFQRWREERKVAISVRQDTASNQNTLEPPIE
jgi:hypothetical protein